MLRNTLGRAVRRRRLIAAALALPALAGCSSYSSSTVGSSSEPAAAELTVFAGSSLTKAFTAIGADFEAAHPGVTVTFNFGPSDGLAASIESEGGADVFASASGTWMDDVEGTTGVTGRTDLVTNKLVVITPPDDPAGITSLEGLAKNGVQVVLAAEGVPVGDYARECLKNAKIDGAVLANVVSNAEDDAAVVATIASGEADAGIVYVSDVTSEVAPSVKAIDIPDDVNVIASYPIAVVQRSENTGLAQQWVDYVTTGPGQSRLVGEFGFLPAG
jgi:molybdate transport system substrate-binding protein